MSHVDHSNDQIAAAKIRSTKRRNASSRIWAAVGPQMFYWARIEEKLLARFETRRKLGCIVNRRHLVLYVYEILFLWEREESNGIILN